MKKILNAFLYLPISVAIFLFIAIFYFSEHYKVLTLLIQNYTPLVTVIIMFIVISITGLINIVYKKRRLFNSIILTLNILAILFFFVVKDIVDDNFYTAPLHRNFSEITSPKDDFHRDKKNDLIRFISLPIGLKGSYIPLPNQKYYTSKYLKSYGIRYINEKGIYGCMVDIKSKKFKEVESYALKYNTLLLEHLEKKSLNKSSENTR